MKLKNTFYFMRHGRSETNIRDILTAAVNSAPLVRYGRSQVRRAGYALRGEAITYIYASPVRRAHETARIVGRLINVPVKVEPGLIEISFGVFDGKPQHEYENFFHSTGERFRHSPRGGETFRDIERRMIATLQRLNARHIGERILLVSHGDPLWLLEKFLTERSEATALRTRPQTYYATAEVRRIVPFGKRYRAVSIVNRRTTKKFHVNV